MVTTRSAPLRSASWTAAATSIVHMASSPGRAVAHPQGADAGAGQLHPEVLVEPVGRPEQPAHGPAAGDEHGLGVRRAVPQHGEQALHGEQLVVLEVGLDPNRLAGEHAEVGHEVPTTAGHPATVASPHGRPGWTRMGFVAGSPFLDRVDAGRQLAQVLLHHRGSGALVLGLPRGGVPVAAEVAAALDAELDVLVVRKLGVPGPRGAGHGRGGRRGLRVLNAEVLARLASPGRGGRRRHRPGRRPGGRAGAGLPGRPAAAGAPGPPRGARGRRPGHGGDDAGGGAGGDRGRRRARRGGGPGGARRRRARRCGPWPTRSCACARPPSFLAVGAWYDDFSETSDDEVRALLARGDQAT